MKPIVHEQLIILGFGDTSSSRVVLSEGTLDNGNHFLNKIFKIGFE
jgi:hypothetical protein